MCSTHEARFLERRGDLSAAVQQAVEQGVEAAVVGGHDLGVVLWQFLEQEEAEHAASAVDAKIHTCFVGFSLQAGHSLDGIRVAEAVAQSLLR